MNGEKDAKRAPAGRRGWLGRFREFSRSGGRKNWRVSAIFTLPGAVVASALLVYSRPAKHEGSPPNEPTGNIGFRDQPSVITGPWGELTVRPMFLDAPESQTGSSFVDQRPIWRFPAQNLPTVREFLGRAGVAPEAVARMTQAEAAIVEKGGVTILPGPEDLVGLSPGSRQILYDALSQHGENPNHNHPLYIFGDVDWWLANAPLPEPTRALIKRLIWRRGGVHAFSDFSLLLQTAASPGDLARIKRVLARTQTLRVAVRRGTLISSEQFVGYWNPAQRNMDALPMIRSIGDDPKAVPIDITHLLPSLARERLYTFPSLQDAVAGLLPDCHWTSLNFFSDLPQPYYLDSNASLLEISQNYEPVGQPGSFGDLVCFSTRAGDITHSCIYLAADIVFTKNGRNASAPWQLMLLGDVAALYRTGATTEMKLYRFKNRGTGP